ncbi:lysophospholipid acyltransferase family protein [bacterium]|nr:lysophospholipid acyltransferase family protein [bacterium]
MVSALVSRLPARAGYAIAVVAGTVWYYGWPRGRRSMYQNYQRVLQTKDAHVLRRTSKSSLINYSRYLADFVRFPTIGRKEIVGLVTGRESFAALDAALERGKGAIIVCMHFGNWDIGAGAAAARGYPLAVVAETFSDPRLDHMVLESRERLGMNVIKMERAGPSMLRVLKQNGLLALLIDRPVPGQGVRVMFFGEEVEVPAGPARLALRSGAAVVPTAFARIKPDGIAVETLTDFSVCCEPTGDEDEDVRRITQAIMTAHEGFIRRYPEQWYMFRELWPRDGAVVRTGCL